MSTSRIVELAAQIQSNTVKYDEYLKANKFASPSFDPDVDQDYAVSGEAQGTKQAVIEALDELHKLLIGPNGLLFHDCDHHGDLISLQAITRFKMGKVLSEQKKEATFDEIAKHSGLSEPTTRRLLRHAMTRRFFQEKRPGYVSHTAASKLITEDPVAEDGVACFTDHVWAAAPRLVDALQKWSESQEPNETGFNIGFNCDSKYWDYIGQDPTTVRQFGNLMNTFSAGDHFSSHHVVDNYPWGALPDNATVVDIGGSHGVHSGAIAKAFPKLKLIVQDREEVVQDVLSTYSSSQIPANLEFMAHDFLTEQPVKGADVYFFRWILHDWSDKYAKEILSCLIPAFKPGSKLVIMDMLLPEPGAVGKVVEHHMREFDLIMFEVFNAKERDETDWRNIFQEVDPRLKFVQAKQPPASALGITVGEWRP